MIHRFSDSESDAAPQQPGRSLIGSLFKRRVAILIVLGVLLTAAITLAIILPRQFQSHFDILVRNKLPASARANSSLPETVDEQRMQSEIALLHSPDLAEKVVDPDWSPDSQHSASETIRHQQAVAVFQQQLETTVPDGFSLIHVTVTADDPHRAAQLANRVLETFFASQQESTRSSGATAFFIAEAARLKNQSAEAQQALDTFLLAHPVTLSGSAAELKQQVIALRQQIRENDEQIDAAVRRILSLERSLLTTPGRQLDPNNRSRNRSSAMPLLSTAQLTRQLAIYNDEQAILLTRPPADETVRATLALASKIASTTEALKQASPSTAPERDAGANPMWQSYNEQITQSSTDLQSLYRNRVALTNQLSGLEDALSAAQHPSSALTGFQENAEVLHAAYRLAEQRANDARIADAMDLQLRLNVAVASRPSFSVTATSPGPWLYAAAIALAAIFLAACLTLLTGIFTHDFDHHEDDQDLQPVRDQELPARHQELPGRHQGLPLRHQGLQDPPVSGPHSRPSAAFLYATPGAFDVPHQPAPWQPGNGKPPNREPASWEPATWEPENFEPGSFARLKHSPAPQVSTPVDAEQEPSHINEEPFQAKQEPLDINVHEVPLHTSATPIADPTLLSEAAQVDPAIDLAHPDANSPADEDVLRPHHQVPEPAPDPESTRREPVPQILNPHQYSPVYNSGDDPHNRIPDFDPFQSFLRSGPGEPYPAVPSFFASPRPAPPSEPEPESFDPETEEPSFTSPVESKAEPTATPSTPLPTTQIAYEQPQEFAQADRPPAAAPIVAAPFAGAPFVEATPIEPVPTLETTSNSAPPPQAAQPPNPSPAPTPTPASPVLTPVAAQTAIAPPAPAPQSSNAPYLPVPIPLAIAQFVTSTLRPDPFRASVTSTLSAAAFEFHPLTPSPKPTRPTAVDEAPPAPPSTPEPLAVEAQASQPPLPEPATPAFPQFSAASALIRPVTLRPQPAWLPTFTEPADVPQPDPPAPAQPPAQPPAEPPPQAARQPYTPTPEEEAEYLQDPIPPPRRLTYEEMLRALVIPEEIAPYIAPPPHPPAVEPSRPLPSEYIPESAPWAPTPATIAAAQPAAISIPDPVATSIEPPPSDPVPPLTSAEDSPFLYPTTSITPAPPGTPDPSEPEPPSQQDVLETIQTFIRRPTVPLQPVPHAFPEPAAPWPPTASFPEEDGPRPRPADRISAIREQSATRLTPSQRMKRGRPVPTYGKDGKISYVTYLVDPDKTHS